MEFDAEAAILPGIIGGIIMARQMKMNLFLMLGTMMVKDAKMA